MHHIIDPPFTEHRVGLVGKSSDSLLQQTLQPASDNIEREPKHQSHDAQKGRNGCPPSCQHRINATAAAMFLALARLYHRLSAHPPYIGKPHVGHGCSSIKTALLLHLFQNVADGLAFVFGQLQSVHHQLVAFYHFAGSKTNRNAASLGMIFNEMHHGMQASVNGTAMVFGTAKVLFFRPLAIFCHMQRVLYQLVHALVFHGRDGNYRYSEHFFHLIDADCSTVVFHLVHHIQCQHHRNVKFHQLHRQVKVTLYVCGIYDIDNARRVFFQDELTRNNLLI